MTTAALDPTAAIVAAGRELVDQLRELVDHVGDEPNDVTGLLDELTTLIRRARGKVGRARKRATEAAPKPATATGGGHPRPHGGMKRADPPASPSAASRSASKATSARTTVHLPRTPTAPGTTTAAQPSATSPARGRHRKPRRAPHWISPGRVSLVVLYVTLAVAVLTGISPLWLAGTVGVAVPLVRWRINRNAQKRPFTLLGHFTLTIGVVGAMMTFLLYALPPGYAI